MNLAAKQRVRAVSAIDVLHRRRVLTPRQLAAARRLASTYTLGIIGLRSTVEALHRVPGSYMEAKVAAERDYESARNLLGNRLWPVVWSVTCGDMSVSEVASMRRINPTATVTLLRVALDMLADRYGLPEDA